MIAQASGSGPLTTLIAADRGKGPDTGAPPRIPDPDRDDPVRLRRALTAAMANGDHATARATAETLCAAGTADARARLHAGLLAAEAGDTDTAESHLRAVLDDPQPAFVHLARLHLARLLGHRGRIGEALALAAAAAETYPADVAAARLLAAFGCGRRT